MATCEAHARWWEALMMGRGQVDFGNGAFRSAYSFKSRFEDAKGTNPEELLGAAPCELLRNGNVARIGRCRIRTRVHRCDRPCHDPTPARWLQDHEQSSGLRGCGAWCGCGYVREACRGRQSGLPGVAGARGYHDHPGRQARAIEQGMQQRIDYEQLSPNAYNRMLALEAYARSSGIEHPLLELSRRGYLRSTVARLP